MPIIFTDANLGLQGIAVMKEPGSSVKDEGIFMFDPSLDIMTIAHELGHLFTGDPGHRNVTGAFEQPNLLKDSPLWTNMYTTIAEPDENTEGGPVVIWKYPSDPQDVNNLMLPGDILWVVDPEKAKITDQQARETQTNLKNKPWAKEIK